MRRIFVSRRNLHRRTQKGIKNNLLLFVHQNKWELHTKGQHELKIRCSGYDIGLQVLSRIPALRDFENKQS